MKTKMDMGENDAEIQMTSFMDCVFLLVIFFLVTSTMKKAHKELEIQLPHSAASIETKSAHDTLIIEVTKKGWESGVYLESEPVTQQLLHKKLRQLAQENPRRRVRIDADRATPFQYVIHIIEVCKFEGLTNVGFHTRD